MAWLLKFLGISSELATHVDGVQLRWAHGELLVIGLVLLVPAAWYIVRRHRHNLPHISPRARNALSVCRIGVLTLLVIVLGSPYLHLDETILHKPVLALIIDESASMGLPAGPFGAGPNPGDQQDRGARSTRLGRQQRPAGRRRGAAQAAQHDEPRRHYWRRLSSSNAVHCSGRWPRNSISSSTASPATCGKTRWKTPTRPPLAKIDTEETALGDAIRHAVDEALGARSRASSFAATASRRRGRIRSAWFAGWRIFRPSSRRRR